VPELRQLRAFVTVAETLNFTRAAEQLHLGQQAVSKRVGQLERELGVTLLERTTREVRLTAAGSALLATGREALAAADRAFAAARAAGRGLAGSVRVGVSPAIGPADRTALIAALRDGAHDLSVALVELRPGDVVPALRDRKVELVVARTAPDAPEVDSAALRPTPAVLFLPRGHRLAGESSIAVSQLDGERLLTWSPPGSPYTDMLVARFAAAGARVEPVESAVTGGGTIPDLASGAVALMPEGWETGPDNVARPIADDVSLPLLVLWPVGAATAAVERVRAGLAAARTD
jgi:DNA-binding transcriptional LysR family regulator